MQPIQVVPSENSQAGQFARFLAIAIGPAYQPADGTRCAADFLALGAALNGAYQTNLASLAEIFVDTAVQLLSEYEAEYGLTPRPDLSIAARQTRLLAKVRAARSGSPQGILKAVRTYDPTATLHEVLPSDISPRTADGVYPGSDRDIYHFTLVVSAGTFNDTDKIASIKAILEQMKPAFVDYRIGTALGFILDVSKLDIDAL